jgi:predicted nucleic acid-binding protein
MALFKREKGADKVETLIAGAEAGQSGIYMNTINLIEVYYLFFRAVGKDGADVILEKIYDMPITFIDTIDDVIFSETSRLKATYSIPLGDAIGMATAIKLGGSFVTGDHSDIEKIEEAESISVFWFR